MRGYFVKTSKFEKQA